MDSTVNRSKKRVRTARVTATVENPAGTMATHLPVPKDNGNGNGKSKGYESEEISGEHSQVLVPSPHAAVLVNSNAVALQIANSRINVDNLYEFEVSPLLNSSGPSRSNAILASDAVALQTANTFSNSRGLAHRPIPIPMSVISQLFAALKASTGGDPNSEVIRNYPGLHAAAEGLDALGIAALETILRIAKDQVAGVSHAFYCFSELPPELRAEIWRLAAPKPSVVVIRAGWMFVNGMHVPMLIPVLYKRPALLCVNRAISTFMTGISPPKAGQSVIQAPGTRFNVNMKTAFFLEEVRMGSQDTLVFRDLILWYNNARGPPLGPARLNFRTLRFPKVENLAVNYARGAYGGFSFPVLLEAAPWLHSLFPDLRKLTLMIARDLGGGLSEVVGGIDGHPILLVPTNVPLHFHAWTGVEIARIVQLFWDNYQKRISIEFSRVVLEPPPRKATT
ncbi:uncharacterized protein LY89DRAFT_765909 [Mollisia scopiformis]|uniref:2EXR domain-containing protein n=1 Tax=Mollisia scopiformis TaxID=149040 RepID=A0A132B667_MOLSC|nr:uncharacterized protein LY89DRAFT_765909 [Mollisia scopiformis]KUJ07831.1 hypothetical protein LY89DRAFT_765909 [Mollisia scopiformis]